MIKTHFSFYFKQTGRNFCYTNGKGLESSHSALRKSEEKDGFKISRKLGTPNHAASGISSLTFYNSKRAVMTPPLKRFKCSPLSSPN